MGLFLTHIFVSFCERNQLCNKCSKFCNFLLEPFAESNSIIIWSLCLNDSFVTCILLPQGHKHFCGVHHLVKYLLAFIFSPIFFPPGAVFCGGWPKMVALTGGVNGPSTGRLRFGWSSIWHSSNTGSPSQQSEQTSILLGSGHFVWPSFLFWIHRIWWGCG